MLYINLSPRAPPANPPNPSDPSNPPTSSSTTSPTTFTTIKLILRLPHPLPSTADPSLPNNMIEINTTPAPHSHWADPVPRSIPLFDRFAPIDWDAVKPYLGIERAFATVRAVLPPGGGIGRVVLYRKTLGEVGVYWRFVDAADKDVKYEVRVGGEDRVSILNLHQKGREAAAVMAAMGMGG